jgi:transcriptional regulator with XRE-family HTH domain
VYDENIKSEGGELVSNEAMAKRLRDLRGEIPRETVSNAVGISKSALSMYERGERIPRDSVKVRLAKFYGKTVEYIFFNH